MQPRPNILLICADQLAQRAVGAYGDPWARTPNIDSLARAGARFANSYTPCPLCLPARAAYWTGKPSHQTGVLGNGRLLETPTVSESCPTLGSVFSEAGYECVHFGKAHDAGSLRGFRVEPWGIVKDESLPAHLGVNNDTYQDIHTTGKCVEYLKGAHDKPFLMVADMQNPHNICGYVGANRGPHEDLPIPGPLPELPDNFEDADLAKRPLPIQYICYSHNRLAQASNWSRDNYRHYLAAYYFYLKLVDRQIGEILAALDASGQRDNTLIVFYADHGDGIASHRMVTKQVSFYEEVSRVPLIVSGAGVAGADRVIEQPLVSLLDLLPTLCDVAGVAAPPDLWGESLRPWIAGQEVGSPHDFVVSEWYSEWGFTISPGRMIRGPRYKYTRYLEGDGEELYDLRSDPGETRTLVDDPAHAEALSVHRAWLDDYIRATGDPFFSLEVKTDPRWRSHPVGYPNHQGPAAPDSHSAHLLTDIGASQPVDEHLLTRDSDLEDAGSFTAPSPQ